MAKRMTKEQQREYLATANKRREDRAAEYLRTPVINAVVHEPAPGEPKKPVMRHSKERVKMSDTCD